MPILRNRVRRLAGFLSEPPEDSDLEKNALAVRRFLPRKRIGFSTVSRAHDQDPLSALPYFYSDSTRCVAGQPTSSMGPWASPTTDTKLSLRAMTSAVHVYPDMKTLIWRAFFAEYNSAGSQGSSLI